jgi:putative molybdopterin biosynthesis protein
MVAIPKHLAVFGNLGSVGGINALRRSLCHMATSHLLQENGARVQFRFPAAPVRPHARGGQFLQTGSGNPSPKRQPREHHRREGSGKSGIRIVNRSLATGTRLLFDRELKRAGIAGERISGYEREVNRHMDVGLEILGGRADAGPGIRPVASLLGLAFLPLRQERYDLLVTRERFFRPGDPVFSQPAPRKGLPPGSGTDWKDTMCPKAAK